MSTVSGHLKLKCTKFDLGWGSVSDPYSAPQTPYLDFMRDLLRGRRGSERKG